MTEPIRTKDKSISIFLHCTIEEKKNADLNTCKKCCMLNSCKILNSPEKKEEKPIFIVSEKANNLLRRLKK